MGTIENGIVQGSTTRILLATLAWQGSDTFLRGTLGPHEQAWLAVVQKVDRSTLPEKLRHNLPDWLAGARIAASRACRAVLHPQAIAEAGQNNQVSLF